MKPHQPYRVVVLCLALGAATVLSGCATTPSAKPYKFKTTDRRTIVIGKSHPSNGGLAYDDPHMDKCWIADGFDFNGYDTLYIAPITSTAKIHDDELYAQDFAKRNLAEQLRFMFEAKAIFTNIVIKESDIKPGAKPLKLSQTIVDYAQGAAAARFFAGPFAGQPDLRVHGVMTDGDKVVFDYTMRRKGTDVGGLMGGPAPDAYLQNSDIRSMVQDLSDFIAAIEGKYTPD